MRNTNSTILPLEPKLRLYLDLLIEATDVRIGFLWGLFQLHDGDHRVGVVGQDADDGVDAVVQKNRAAWRENN